MKTQLTLRSGRLRNPASAWLLTVLALLVLLFGLIAALGVPLLAFFAAVPILALLMISRPVWILWGVLVGGLIVAGLAELYVPMLRQARWGVVLAAVFLGLISLFASRLQAPSRATPSPNTHRRSSAFLVWMMAFLTVAIFSGLVNEGFSMDTLIGLKGYFQVWGVVLALGLLTISEATVDRMMYSLAWLGLLQLPFALHQSFFLVPQRMGSMDVARNVVAQDIVVGTFSGSMTGGGAGPSMAILLGIALTIFLAKWKGRQISNAVMVVSALICLAPIALGEHKLAMVFVVLIPLLVYGDQLLRNPFRTAALGTFSVALASVLFVAFTMLPGIGGGGSRTIGEHYQQTLDYNIGDKGYGSLYLNRAKVYAFWWRTHQSGGGGFVSTLIGYGPGATNEVRTAFKERSFASTHYPRFGIGLTGLSGLLWEVGLLGTAAAVGFLATAFHLARRLAREVDQASPRWAYLKGAEAGVAMVALSLLHSSILLFEIGAQTLLVLLLGYLWYWAKRPGERNAVS